MIFTIKYFDSNKNEICSENINISDKNIQFEIRNRPDISENVVFIRNHKLNELNLKGYEITPEETSYVSVFMEISEDVKRDLGSYNTIRYKIGYNNENGEDNLFESLEFSN